MMASDLCATNAGQTVACPVNAAASLAGLLAKLPAGWAWESASVDGTLMNGMFRATAEMFADLEAAACELLGEFHCNTATLTLDNWNDDYGLPDPCGIDNLCAKVVATGGQTAAYLHYLGLQLGYDLCIQDLAPEAQCGNWNLGCDQLAPAATLAAGGSELGFACLGYCPGNASTIDLGQADYAAGPGAIAGEFAKAGSVATTVHADCERWPGVCTETLICGKGAPYDISGYTGTAHSFIVGLPTDSPLITGNLGYCDSGPGVGSSLSQLGFDPLGRYVAATAGATQLITVDLGQADYEAGVGATAGDYEYVSSAAVISGSQNGIIVLTPSGAGEVACLIERYKPAHCVAIRTACL